jgi:Leucine-rich repeat (LRR) protein
MLSMGHLRDVKRFYLSGNPIPTAFPSEKFFNLTYLELAMCQITTLPENLATVVPNVRTLNLNHNFIEDLSPLSGLSRLGKLTVVGARLSKCRPIASVLETMPELEVIDLR